MDPVNVETVICDAFKLDRTIVEPERVDPVNVETVICGAFKFDTIIVEPERVDPINVETAMLLPVMVEYTML